MILIGRSDFYLYGMGFHGVFLFFISLFYVWLGLERSWFAGIPAVFFYFSLSSMIAIVKILTYFFFF